jgi:ubiquinone/menaquinone biosynthesis C-methylase UbiE
MTALDIGCGRGFNSIGLARIVGKEGRVISVDVQQEMLNMLERRARRAGLADRIYLHRCETDTLGIQETVDFANAFWMVHEVPDTGNLLSEIFSILKPDGKLLIAEPKFHVSPAAFQEMISIAESTGFRIYRKPEIAFSRAVILLKP